MREAIRSALAVAGSVGSANGPAPAALGGDALLALAEANLKDGHSEAALRLATESLHGARPDSDVARILLVLGRALLQLRFVSEAIGTLERHVALAPGSLDGKVFLARAYQQAGIPERAMPLALAVCARRPDHWQAVLTAAQLAHGLAFSGYGNFLAGAAEHLELAEAFYGRLLDARPDHRDAACGLVRLLIERGDRLTARATLDRFITGSLPRKTVEAVLRTYVNGCLAGGWVADAAARIPQLRASSDDQTFADRAARICGVPRPGEALPGTVRIGVLVAGLKSVFATFGQSETISEATVARHPSRLRDFDLVYVGHKRAEPFQAIAVGSAARLHDVAGVAVTSGKRLLGRFVKPDHVADGVESGDLAGYLGSSRHRWHHWPATLDVPPERLENAGGLGARRRILLLSRNGYRPVGGGERFLLDCAHFYGERGIEPIIVGLEESGDGRVETAANGTSFAFIREDPSALRELVLRTEAGAVHTMSGLGLFVLTATDELAVVRIYGVHFWREAILSSVNHAHYFPPEALASPRLDPAFPRILERFDYVYANSPFVRGILGGLTGAFLPVIPSIAREEAPSETSGKRASAAQGPLSGYVLLVNSRPDKGFKIVLDCARAMPDRPFVVVANQSTSDQARWAADAAGLANLMVLSRTDDMATLYRHAAVVVVPSFEFTETFGRVPVEAARFGKPCLMARNGNLIDLAADEAELLSPEPRFWIEGLKRFFADSDFRRRLERAAETRNLAWPHSRQRAGLERVVAKAERARVLVCAGAGVGNVLHVTPLIRVAADRVGGPVDCLVAGDARGTGALLAGNDAVGMVFEELRHVEHRPYDLVWVTHSFGTPDVRFNCRSLARARSIRPFEPGGDVHEAQLNLDCFAELLGFELPPDAVRRYFVSDLSYRFPASRRIVFHAGSKGGKWATKRWPHFEALGQGLRDAGYAVASVGTADEHVPGTENWTGGSLLDMARRMLDCDLAVSNDSGVMNIANALGIPLAVFFAPTNPVTRGPLNSRSLILRPAVDCSPCESKPAFKPRFDAGRCSCLASVKPAAALERILRFCESSPAKRAA